MKMEQKKGKLKKGRWKIEHGRMKSYEKRGGPFSKQVKFVLGLREKIRKNYFTPSENMPVTPVCVRHFESLWKLISHESGIL